MTAVRLTFAAVGLALFLACVGCGETYRPVANPIIPNPPNPNFSHVVLVLSTNGSNNPGASSTIDVSGDSDVSQSTLGLMPVHAVLALNGTRAYVANTLDDTVSTYSASTSAPVTTISLPAGSAPVFMATTENATVYVANSGNNTVSAISTSSNVVSRTISVGPNPVAMAETPNGLKLYVANHGNGTVVGSVLSINTVDKTANPCIPSSWISPVSVAVRSDSARVYVLDQGAGMVSVIDTSSDTVLGTPVSVGLGANFMLYDTSRSRLYVTNPATNTLTYLDASTDALTPVTVTVANPISVAALRDGSRVYVSSATVTGTTVTSQVVVINALDGSIKTTVPLTSVAQSPVCASKAPSELSMAAAADSSRVYVGNCDSGNIAIVQTSNDSLLLQMPAPLGAFQPPQTTAPPQNPVFVLAGP